MPDSATFRERRRIDLSGIGNGNAHFDPAAKLSETTLKKISKIQTTKRTFFREKQVRKMTLYEFMEYHIFTLVYKVIYEQIFQNVREPLPLNEEYKLKCNFN